MLDFHFHTNLSIDGKDSLLAFCEQAVALGAKTVCVTDHFDVNYGGNPDARVPGPEDVMQAYAEAREAYPALDLRLGMEVGYRQDSHCASALMLARYPLDFVINSVHEVGGKDAYFPEYFEGLTREQAYLNYLEAVFESLDAAYDYSVIGHLGYVYRNAPYIGAPLHRREFPDLIDGILMRLVYLGKGIEVNTSTLRVHNETMPVLDIIRRYKELGGEIITIGSDAHTVARLGDGYLRALEAVRTAGFTHITAFRGFAPKFIKI